MWKTVKSANITRVIDIMWISVWITVYNYVDKGEVINKMSTKCS